MYDSRDPNRIPKDCWEAAAMAKREYEREAAALRQAEERRRWRESTDRASERRPYLDGGRY